jgi:hypothetical protein
MHPTTTQRLINHNLFLYLIEIRKCVFVVRITRCACNRSSTAFASSTRSFMMSQEAIPGPSRVRLLGREARRIVGREGRVRCCCRRLSRGRSRILPSFGRCGRGLGRRRGCRRDLGVVQVRNCEGTGIRDSPLRRCSGTTSFIQI